MRSEPQTSSIDVTTGAASVAATFGGGNTVTISRLRLQSTPSTPAQQPMFRATVQTTTDRVSAFAPRPMRSVSRPRRVRRLCRTLAASVVPSVAAVPACRLQGPARAQVTTSWVIPKPTSTTPMCIPATDVTVSTNQTNIIGANVAAVAAATGASGTAGVGVALGGSFAPNNIRGEG